ncbi:MAG: class I SAM-dependent methyltransferase [Deltaproteobacteria bacterium]|nr:class I SAM-dependent methyltransferase [Deltaproteobacteria bacterium]MBW2530416.1 class I SAM-dependent methyltransferase [Deltaproteobacteria bacterium]
MPKPSSAYVDGWLYAMVFDRLLAPIHRFVAKQVAGADQVIDVCCGTGSLARRLASRCHRVMGVDLSPRMIRHAKRRCAALGLDNAEFQVRDASDLADIDDGAFEAATLVLGLHEMPPALRANVLAETLRVSQRALIVDYAVPLPRNWVSGLCVAAEIACGPRHLGHFVSYNRRRGLDGYSKFEGLPAAHPCLEASEQPRIRHYHP